MKRILSVFLILMLLSVFPLIAAIADEPSLSGGLQEWMAVFKEEYLRSDPTVLPPSIPVIGWSVYTGGDWSSQYPPDWAVLSGDFYSFLVCDSRRLSCYDYVEVQQFPQPLSHDQIGVYALGRVMGTADIVGADTFQKNVFPQLMLQAPSGISQVYFVRWKHPQAGNMFTLLQVLILSYFDSFAGGSTSASWSSFSAPEDEFVAIWQGIFAPMFYSATHVIPGGASPLDSDDDGYPDEMDEYPRDPYRY